MPHLTQIELESIRHLVADCDLKARKLGEYARDVRNADLRGWCQREADAAARSRQTLIGFLSEGVNVQ